MYVCMCMYLLPPTRDQSVISRLRTSAKFPKVYTCTKRYCSFINYALNNYQDKIIYSNTLNTHITPNYLLTHVFFILYRVFLLLIFVVSIVSVCLFIWLYLQCTWLFLLHISLSFLLQTVVFIVFIYSALQLQV